MVEKIQSYGGSECVQPPTESSVFSFGFFFFSATKCAYCPSGPRSVLSNGASLKVGDLRSPPSTRANAKFKCVNSIGSISSTVYLQLPERPCVQSGK